MTSSWLSDVSHASSEVMPCSAQLSDSMDQHLHGGTPDRLLRASTGDLAILDDFGADATTIVPAHGRPLPALARLAVELQSDPAASLDIILEDDPEPSCHASDKPTIIKPVLLQDVGSVDSGAATTHNPHVLGAGLLAARWACLETSQDTAAEQAPEPLAVQPAATATAAAPEPGVAQDTGAVQVEGEGGDAGHGIDVPIQLHPHSESIEEFFPVDDDSKQVLCVAPPNLELLRSQVRQLHLASKQQAGPAPSSQDQQGQAPVMLPPPADAGAYVLPRSVRSKLPSEEKHQGQHQGAQRAGSGVVCRAVMYEPAYHLAQIKPQDGVAAAVPLRMAPSLSVVQSSAEEIKGAGAGPPQQGQHEAGPHRAGSLPGPAIPPHLPSRVRSRSLPLAQEHVGQPNQVREDHIQPPGLYHQQQYQHQLHQQQQYQQQQQQQQQQGEPVAGHATGPARVPLPATPNTALTTFAPDFLSPPSVRQLLQLQPSPGSASPDWDPPGHLMSPAASGQVPGMPGMRRPSGAKIKPMKLFSRPSHTLDVTTTSQEMAGPAGPVGGPPGYGQGAGAMASRQELEMASESEPEEMLINAFQPGVAERVEGTLLSPDGRLPASPIEAWKMNQRNSGKSTAHKLSGFATAAHAAATSSQRQAPQPHRHPSSQLPAEPTLKLQRAGSLPGWQQPGVQPPPAQPPQPPQPQRFSNIHPHHPHPHPHPHPQPHIYRPQPLKPWPHLPPPGRPSHPHSHPHPHPPPHPPQPHTASRPPGAPMEWPASAELAQLLRSKCSLRQAQEAGNHRQLQLLLGLLSHLPVSDQLLADSQVAPLVRGLRKHQHPGVAQRARHLVEHWREVLAACAAQEAARHAPKPKPRKRLGSQSPLAKPLPKKRSRPSGAHPSSGLPLPRQQQPHPFSPHRPAGPTPRPGSATAAPASGTPAATAATASDDEATEDDEYVVKVTQQVQSLKQKQASKKSRGSKRAGPAAPNLQHTATMQLLGQQPGSGGSMRSPPPMPKRDRFGKFISPIKESTGMPTDAAAAAGLRSPAGLGKGPLQPNGLVTRVLPSIELPPQARVNNPPKKKSNLFKRQKLVGPTFGLDHRPQAPLPPPPGTTAPGATAGVNGQRGVKHVIKVKAKAKKRVGQGQGAPQKPGSSAVAAGTSMAAAAPGQVPNGAYKLSEPGLGEGLGAGGAATTFVGGGGDDGLDPGSAGGTSRIKSPPWSTEEIRIYTEILRVHGRDVGKLREALPNRPLEQLRNFFHNHRRKRNLDGLLSEAGHPLYEILGLAPPGLGHEPGHAAGLGRTSHSLDAVAHPSMYQEDDGTSPSTF